MKLTQEQRKLLVGWAAEGLTLKEINQRAEAHDPPFEVDWNQLKHVRSRTDKTYSDLKEDFERDALSEGYARRGVRIRLLESLIEKHLALVKARGEEMADEVPGGRNGLYARDYKGKDADRAVYKYDAALVREIRGLADDIAKELGERRTRIDLMGKLDVTKLSDEELNAIIRTEGEGGT